MADELYDKFEQYEWEKDAVFQVRRPLERSN